MKGIVLVLFGVIITVTSQDVDKCLDTVIYHNHCCDFVKNEANLAIIRKCHGGAPDLQFCEFERCYGKERGFILSNGTLDKNLLIQAIKKDLENYTDVYDVVKEECLAEHLNFHGHGDACYLRELGNCLQFFAMVKCPNWINSDECTKVKETIQECAKRVS